MHAVKVSLITILQIDLINVIIGLEQKETVCSNTIPRN